ncbi:MAG: hypothetical protein EA398_03000, partial [Deltaproteobacteria bacterium]
AIDAADRPVARQYGSRAATINGICQSECAQEEQCYAEDFNEEYDSVAECVAECVEEGTAFLAQATQACADALIAVANCTGALSCADLEDYYEEPTPDYPCNQEDAAVEAACDADFGSFSGGGFTGGAMFTCDDGSEIPMSWVCDGDLDCPGGEDEENCPSDAFFTCDDGSQIPAEWVCDGDLDCPGGEDEDDC